MTRAARSMAAPARAAGATLFSALALLGAFFAGSGAYAQAVYRAQWGLTATEWSGLSAYGDLLRATGFDVREDDTWELAPPQPGDVVVLIAPGAGVNARAIEAWTGLGGGMVLAEDRPGSTLARIFGVRTSRAPACPGPRLLDDCALPVARPVGPGAGSRVELLAMNRPAALSGAGASVMEVGDGVSVARVVTSRDGSNHVVVVGDPSLWINLMLPVLDNALVAVGAVKIACGQPTCRVRVVSGDRELVASPELEAAWAARDTSVRARAEGFLGRLFDARVSRREAAWLSALVALMALVQLLALLPLRRPDWIRPALERPRRHAVSEFEGLLERSQGGRDDATAEAAILLATWRDVAGPAGYVPAEGTWLARQRAARAWARKHLPTLEGIARLRAERRYARLLRASEKIPSVGTFDPLGTPLEDVDLAVVHGDIQWALGAMGKMKELDERRRRPT